MIAYQAESSTDAAPHAATSDEPKASLVHTSWCLDFNHAPYVLHVLNILT